MCNFKHPVGLCHPVAPTGKEQRKRNDLSNATLDGTGDEYRLVRHAAVDGYRLECQ